MEIWTSGVRRVTFAAPTSAAQEWDLFDRGPRFVSFPHRTKKYTEPQRRYVQVKKKMWMAGSVLRSRSRPSQNHIGKPEP